MESVATRKGWFAISGVQDGHRGLGEQLKGLEHALARASGKSVADLGCAEGLIGIEFARAGAARVHGWDNNADSIRVAQALQAPGCEFRVGNLNHWTAAPGRYDIVLALAVLHKLHWPHRGVQLAAAMAGELLVVRLPLGSRGRIRGKSTGMEGDLPGQLPKLGLRLELEVEGPRKEWVQYWRRG